MKVWILLVLVLVAGCNGCASKPPDAVLTEAGTEWFHYWGGVTICAPGQKKPVLWLRSDQAEEWVKGGRLRAHEEGHERRALTFPDCDTYRKWLAVGDNRTLAEVDGHCAEVEWDVERGLVRAFVIEYEAWRMAGRRDLSLTMGEARKLLKGACG